MVFPAGIGSPIASSSASQSPQSDAGVGPIPSPSPQPSPSPPQTITIKDSELGYVRIRDGPSTSFEEIGQVLPGQTIEVFEQSEDWYQIEYEKGKYGWVSGNEELF